MEALIRTKFYIPQVQPNWVARPRLVDLLSEGVERSLTLVSAPPGFGKTTLLSEWVAAGAKNTRGKSLPVAWLSLDDRDNDPVRFGTYLLAALSRLDLQIDASQFASPASGHSPLDLLITALINQVAETAAEPASPLHGGFVLVLDDHHQITAPAVQNLLALLLTHLPPQMHVIIASRADPMLPLAQLRARRQLLELRASDLRFQPDEIKIFLNQKMGLNLSAEAMSTLDTRTEGWAAALQLAALAMQNMAKAGSTPENPVSLLDFTGSHRYIVDYLAEQVLNQQPPHIQEFLLATSVLERLSGPLCDVVIRDEGRRTDEEGNLSSSVLRPSSNSQAMLETLERANLFLVPLDGVRQWYRYHPLFAGFLRGRLVKSHPDRRLELHRRAAEYFERSGLIPEAVDHVLAVGDSLQAARMVEQIAEEIWMSGEMIRLLGWLEALPDELIRSHPRLCIFHAWILNILADSTATEGRLRDAEQALARTGGEFISNQDVTRGMLAATRAIIAIMEGDAAGAVELSQRALEYLPEDNWVWKSVVIRNLGNAYLLTGQTASASQAFQEAFWSSQAAGNAYMTIVTLYELAELQIVQGQLHKAYRTCLQALDLASGQTAPGFAITGAVHVGLSEVLREWNDLDGGVRHALLGIEFGRQGRSLGIQVCGYTRLALLTRARGDEGGAVQYFQCAAQLAPLRRRTSFIAHHDVQASLWGRQGDPESVIYWSRQNGLLTGLQPTGEINYMNETAHIALVRALLGLNHAEAAYKLGERLRQDAESAGRGGRLIEILALQALALKALGDQLQALAVLRQALTLAEPQGYIRVFVDEGEHLALLIHELRSEIENQRRSSSEEKQRRLLKYIQKLLTAFRSGPVGKPTFHRAAQTAPRPQVGPATLPRPFPGCTQPPNLRLYSTAQSPFPNLHSPFSNPLEPLSERETEILRLIASGLSNQEVARRLVLAPSTIHWHMKNIYSKLDVHSRTQAVARAVELGIFL